MQTQVAERVNPIHVGRDKVRLDHVYPDYEDAALNDEDYMKTYKVAVGWYSTIVSRRGDRRLLGHPEFVGKGDNRNPIYRTATANRCAELREEMKRRDDEVLYFITVYAHNRRDVVKLYELEDSRRSEN